MRRIKLTVDGEKKYEVIKELVEQNGNKNRAASLDMKVIGCIHSMIRK